VDWAQVGGAIIAAAAALGGVRYGARLSEATSSLAWGREQRLKSYVELIEALDHCYSAFRLINSTLDLANYTPSRALIEGPARSDLEDWGHWDELLDNILPRAELVCGSDLQPFLSVGIRYGMRSRHRVLLMKLTHSLTADAAEWKSVTKLTLDDLVVRI
jgi:hypothetical protein